MKNLILFFLSITVLASCSKQSKTQNLSTQKKSLRQAEFLRDSAQFTDSKGTEIDAISYFLRGSVDWEHKKFLSELTIIFKLNAPSETKLSLDSNVNKVTSVKHQGKDIAFIEQKSTGLLDISLETLTPQEKNSPIELKISYEALARTDLADTGFQIVLPRAGDPVKAKAAFTFAEPESATTWMPCHNTPRDRALFGSEFAISEQETLVSNGDLINDAIDSSTQKRIMRYQTRYTLPTYLMAFTVGEFSVNTLYLNELPISVVSRKGLRIDSNGILNRLIKYISHYQDLTVKYPFEKYMLVLLPDFISGGIEHAGITFQTEERSSQSMISYDSWLTSHELAHQWFGDLMTIRSWDDLWIKEGMATLLAEESSRFFEDQNNKGRLFGKNYAVVASEAVVDPGLKPDDKYTSGPYDRAAWVYSQLRSHLGEQRFWGMMKKALTENAFGVISTDELLQRYVTPYAGETYAAQMKKALFAKTLPTIYVSENANQIEVSMEDPEGILLVPMHFRSLTQLNSSQVTKLQSGNSFKFNKGDLLLMNLNDIHPLLPLVERTANAKKDLYSSLVPHSNEQLNYLAELSAEQPSNAIINGEGWSLTPILFDSFYHRLNSEDSKYNFIKLGCALAKKSSSDALLWKDVISKALSSFPVLGMPRTIEDGIFLCDGLINEEIYKPTWNKIAHDPIHPSLNDKELLKTANFPGTDTEVFITFKPVAENGYSVRAKAIAMMRLSKHFRGKLKEATSQEVWLAFFKSVLATSELSDVLVPATEAVVSARDKEAVSALKRVVESPVGSKARLGALCGVHTILKAESIQWKSFKNSLSSELPPYLNTVLENPQKCGDEDRFL